MTRREAELEIQNRQLLLVQQQLALSRMRYADLFDFAPIGYATLRGDCRIEEINLAGATLLGRTPRQLIGRVFDEFVVANDLPKFHEHIERCRHSVERLTTELRLLACDSTTIDVELYTVATHEVEQGKLQCRCAIVNVTDRKHAEESLRRSEIELELRAKHHFLSEASAVFSGSLDYDTVLSNIVRMSIPQLADCCAIDMVQPDGSFVRSAVGHVDHDKEPLLWKLGKIPEGSPEAFGKSKVIRRRGRNSTLTLRILC